MPGREADAPPPRRPGNLPMSIVPHGTVQAEKNFPIVILAPENDRPGKLAMRDPPTDSKIEKNELSVDLFYFFIVRYMV